MDTLGFRKALKETLQETGLSEELKVHLRTKLIEHLNGTEISFPPISIRKAPTSHNVIHSIANVLIADYLKSHQMDYSLSVFLPESGLSQPPRVDTNDMIELLRLDSTTKGSAAFKLVNALTQQIPKDLCGKSFLECLLIGIRSLCSQTCSNVSQTEGAINEECT